MELELNDVEGAIHQCFWKKWPTPSNSIVMSALKKNSGKPLTNAQCLQNLNKISRNNMGNLASCNRLICIKLPSKPTSEINERIRMNDMLKEDHDAFGSRRTRV